MVVYMLKHFKYWESPSPERQGHIYEIPALQPFYSKVTLVDLQCPTVMQRCSPFHKCPRRQGSIAISLQDMFTGHYSIQHLKSSCTSLFELQRKARHELMPCRLMNRKCDFIKSFFPVYIAGHAPITIA